MSALTIRLDKPWVPLAETASRLRGNLGVFELAESSGEVLYIGFAGARSRFGLQGEVEAMAAQIPEAAAVRWEITSAYQSRFRELLALHQADFGELPRCNRELGHHPVVLGRLSPA